MNFLANSIRAVVKIKKNLILFFVLSNHVKYSPRYSSRSRKANDGSIYPIRFSEVKIQQNKMNKEQQVNVRECLSSYLKVSIIKITVQKKYDRFKEISTNMAMLICLKFTPPLPRGLPTKLRLLRSSASYLQKKSQKCV